MSAHIKINKIMSKAPIEPKEEGGEFQLVVDAEAYLDGELVFTDDELTMGFAEEQGAMAMLTSFEKTSEPIFISINPEGLTKVMKP